MKDKKKLLKVAFFVFTFLILSLIYNYIINNRSNLSDKNEIDNYETINLEEINDNHYDISINVNDSTAVVDGVKYKLDETSSDELYDYIKENSYGEVSLNGEEIEITNPYSLESLIVKTDDESIFEEYENIEKVEEISEDLYKVVYKNAKDTKDGFEELNNNEKIEKVSTDIKVVALGDVNSYDVMIYPWGVSNMGLDYYSNKLEEENNNTIVKIAVLDTGIRATHDIFTSVTSQDRLDFDGAYDYVNDDNDPSDDNTTGIVEDSYGNTREITEYGHGTMVSGVIAESTSTNVKIVPVKVLDNTGSGLFSDVLRAINDVKDKVNIINLSLGAPISDDVFEATLKDIYDKTDVVIVAAAGNDCGNVVFPANSPYTLAISSVNYKNEFSSSFSSLGSEVDFAAPGEDLYLPSLYGNSTYVANRNGTSFSAPFASAAIALIKASNPTYTREEIIDYLKHNVVDLGDKGKDIYYGYGSISIHSFINDLSVSNNWGKTNTLTVTAEAASTTNYYAITQEEVEPTTWTNLPSSQNITITENINENGTYYLWIKNNSITNKYNNGTFRTIDNVGITHAQFEVTHVDNSNPVIVNSLNVNDKSSTLISVNLTALDDKSGLSKIIWHCKKNYETTYTSIVLDLNNETSSTFLTKTFEGLESYTTYNIYAEIYDQVNNVTTTDVINVTTLQDGTEPSIIYQTHVQDVGWQDYVSNGMMSGTQGKSLRLEGIRINLVNKNSSGDIEYRTHIQNIGWESGFKKNNEMSGTSGKSLRLEAIEIKLTGEMAEHYDIYYRVHAQMFGWLGWARNGERAGTAGYSYRLEGIEIKLIPKGETFFGYGTGLKSFY